MIKATPYGDDAVNARQNNVTNHGERLKALLSKLSNLKIVNKESKAVREPSNASLPESPKLERTQPTDKDSERGDLSDTQHSTGSASATTPPSEYGYADDAGRGTAILSSVMFMPAISMDDIEGWEPVGENQ